MTGAALAMPACPLTGGQIELRPFTEADVPMLLDLSTDPHLPLTGTLPAHTDAAGGLSHLSHGRATAGYGIAPKARGHGFGGQALSALTEFAWTVPGLHRIELYVEPWNVASCRVAETAGYTYEGLLRSHQEIGGQRVDMRLYASIRSTV